MRTRTAAGAVRDAINSEIDRRGWTVYRLAKELEDAGRCSRSALYKCMNGSTSMSIDLAGYVFEILELEIVPRGHT